MTLKNAIADPGGRRRDRRARKIDTRGPVIRPRRIGRWPSEDVRLEHWLGAIEADQRYPLNALVQITGATAHTLRGILHRGGLPEACQPSGYGRNGQTYWTADQAVAFLHWLGREVHLPDAFKEPMVAARDAASMLGMEYGSFRNAVCLGRLPKPAVQAQAQRRALWRATDIESVLRGKSA